jgi:serine/threonine protein kinase
MEFVEDGSLEDFLQSSRMRTLDSGYAGLQWRLRVCEQLLQGMCDIAARDVVHRDLAARNVLLRHAASELMVETKITDFGLSRITSRYMREGGSAFPWRYAAIECLPYGANVTTKADVWAMGLLLWVRRTCERTRDRMCGCVVVWLLVRRARDVARDGTCRSCSLERRWSRSRTCRLCGTRCRCWSISPGFVATHRQ